MTRTRSLFLLPLLVATAFLAACGGDSGTPTDPNNPGSGTVSFGYSGAISGSFNATGAVRWVNSTTPEFNTFAVGWRESGAFGIWAFRAGSNNRGDFLIIDAYSSLGTGTYSIEETCDDSSPRCVEIKFAAGLDLQTYEARLYCEFTSGSMNVTAASATEARGTFSGQGDCWDIDGEFEGPITITNGAFQVPLVGEP